MDQRELNRATIEVVSSMGISGRAAADGINRGSQTEERGCLWPIANSAIRGFVMAIGLLVALLAPLPASADDNKDSGNGHQDNDKGIRAEIAALKSQVAVLRDQVNSLQTQLAAVQSNHALLLGPFVNVDPNPEVGVIGPNIVFSGANIHIVSGSGSTDDNGNATGLGNLIIGYDEDPINPLPGDSSLGLPTIMQTSGFPSPLNPGDRGGSHNLVIGGGNRFTKAAFAGFVAGERNTIDGFGASVSGGFFSNASGLFASISGGIRNTASGLFASVSAGGLNQASGTDASVSGGFENSVTGAGASASGGVFNQVSGLFCSITGGGGNSTDGFQTIVIGGNGVTDNGFSSIAPQPPFP
jgi:hypothetical protein